MQRITPFLWFDDQAEAAAKFYVSVFKNSKITGTSHYTGEEPSGQKGSVMTVSFELDGQEFVALNGGPRFKFTEAVSFVVNCETQEEIDSWQVVPAKIREWMEDKDPARTQRVMHAVMQMKKLDMAAMQRAYDGK